MVWGKLTLFVDAFTPANESEPFKVKKESSDWVLLKVLDEDNGVVTIHTTIEGLKQLRDAIDQTLNGAK